MAEPTQEQIRKATSAVADEYGSKLCAWIDMSTARVCRVNIGKSCRCREIAVAALTAALNE